MPSLKAAWYADVELAGNDRPVGLLARAERRLGARVPDAARARRRRRSFGSGRSRSSMRPSLNAARRCGRLWRPRSGRRRRPSRRWSRPTSIRRCAASSSPLPTSPALPLGDVARLDAVTSATARVPAKINLCLGVGPRREDGFHPLATVYQALDVYDEVHATSIDDSDDITVSVQIESSTETGDVPVGDDNLAARAARALRDATGIESGIRLAIRKVIPVAGGMAGGSADAAAALLACNAVWGAGLSRDELSNSPSTSAVTCRSSCTAATAMGGGRGENVSPILGRGSLLLDGRGLGPRLADAGGLRRVRPADAGERDVPQPTVPDDLLAALRAGDAGSAGRCTVQRPDRGRPVASPDLHDVLAVG